MSVIRSRSQPRSIDTRHRWNPHKPNTRQRPWMRFIGHVATSSSRLSWSIDRELAIGGRHRAMCAFHRWDASIEYGCDRSITSMCRSSVWVDRYAYRYRSISISIECGCDRRIDVLIVGVCRSIRVSISISISIECGCDRYR